MSSAVPLPIAGLTSGVTSLSAGSESACAVTALGGVVCWGGDDFGELGNDSTSSTPSLVPVQVTGLARGVRSVAVGGNLGFACAVTADGAALCWGDDFEGGLANDGGLTMPACCATAPVQVAGLASGVGSVAAGYSSACAVTAGGGVVCWGGSSSIPVPVPGLSAGVTSVSVGYDSSCAVTAGGGVVCWGLDTYGQLGNDSTANAFSSVPVQVTGLTSGVTSVSVGRQSACALTTRGAVVCWGNNGIGQLGNNSRVNSSVPVQVVGLTSGVRSLSVGASSTACAVTAGGAVECWGENNIDLLGSLATSFSSVPVPIPGF